MFRMMDCKPMTTPMNSNLKLLQDDSSEAFDPTVYRQVIGSLMYLVNTRLDICFAVNALSQYMVAPRQVHWIAAKHVLRYYWIWSQLCLGSEDGAARIYRFRLGRKHSGQKEYFRLLLQSRIRHDLVVLQEADFSSSQYGRIRVYRSLWCKQRSSVASEVACLSI